MSVLKIAKSKYADVFVENTKKIYEKYLVMSKHPKQRYQWCRKLTFVRKFFLF